MSRYKFREGKLPCGKTLWGDALFYHLLPKTNFEIASHSVSDIKVCNAYKILGDVQSVSRQTGVSEEKILEILRINNVFLSSRKSSSYFGRRDIFGNSI